MLSLSIYIYNTLQQKYVFQIFYVNPLKSFSRVTGEHPVFLWTQGSAISTLRPFACEKARIFC